MKKVLKIKEKINGYPKQQIGLLLGIQDKNNNWLKVGDKVIYKDFEGRILYSPAHNAYRFYYKFATDFGNNEYDVNNYSRSLPISMDNGSKCELRKREDM